MTDHRIDHITHNDNNYQAECTCGWVGTASLTSRAAASAMTHLEPHDRNASLNWAGAVIDYQIDDLEDGLINEADLL